MSLRTNGNNATGAHETSPLPSANITVCCFAKIIATTIDIQTIFELSDNSGPPPTNLLELNTDSSNANWILSDSGSDLVGIPIVIGQWYFLAATNVAGAARVLYCMPLGGGMSRFQGTAQASYTPQILAVGGEATASAQSGNPSHACIAGVRVWNNVVMSQEALYRESQSIKAYSRANLFLEWPLNTDLDLTDAVQKVQLAGTAAQLAPGEWPAGVEYLPAARARVYSVPSAQAQNPQAVWTDVGARPSPVPFRDIVTLQRIDPATFQPIPRLSEPALWGAGRYAESPAFNRRIDPASFQPTPSASTREAWSDGRYRESPTANQRIDPATFQPNPSASTKELWSDGRYKESLVAHQFIDPAAFRPTPGANYLTAWSPGAYALSQALNRRVDPATFQPNPAASYPCIAGSIYRDGTWYGSFIIPAPAATFNPAAFYPDRSPEQWHARESIATSQRIDPASFQPTPSAVYRNESASISRDATWHAAFVIPSRVNPAAFYPDRSPDSWHVRESAFTLRRIDPATFQPSLMAVYANPWADGRYHESWTGIWIPTPPAVNPSASYPQRHPDQWHAREDWATPKWVDPASFRPVPSAVYLNLYARSQYSDSIAASVRPSGPFIPVSDYLIPYGRSQYNEAIVANVRPVAPFIALATYLTPSIPGAYRFSEVADFAPQITPNPSAQFDQKQWPQWHAPGDFAANRRVDPSAFQPNPSANWVDLFASAQYLDRGVATAFPIVVQGGLLDLDLADGVLLEFVLADGPLLVLRASDGTLLTFELEDGPP